MSASCPPKIESTQEVRFAVVMYGGVSLAIYINGITQELLRMVRSTANAAKDSQGKPVALSGEQTAQPQNTLTGTERVYRKLSYLLSDETLLSECRTLSEPKSDKGESFTELKEKLENLLGQDRKTITTRFIVDILSGTSAGGINSIFLAKALANDQRIDRLKQLWINEGDIRLLLNDAESFQGTNLLPQDRPQSLLNSRRMYLKLLKAFDDMERDKPRGKEFISPYTEELDLFPQRYSPAPRMESFAVH